MGSRQLTLQRADRRTETSEKTPKGVLEADGDKLKWKQQKREKGFDLDIFCSYNFLETYTPV